MSFFGREINDKDYCVVGLDRQEFINLFPEAHIRGKDFEVFDIERNRICTCKKRKKNRIRA